MKNSRTLFGSTGHMAKPRSTMDDGRELNMAGNISHITEYANNLESEKMHNLCQELSKN